MGIAKGEDKRWLRTACFRSEVFDYLNDHATDSWKLDRKTHSLNGAVHLAHADGDLSLRVLRAVPLRGGVPCAGSNGQRRAYFSNRPYAQLGLWGASTTHNLLTLWDEHDEEISLRLVRPIGPGTALKGVPIDLSVDLPRSRTAFESTKFEIFDEDLDDNAVSFEEGEESDGAS